MISICWLSSSLIAQCNNTDDYTALRALYLSTDGDNWTNNTGWPSAATFSTNTTPPAGTDLSTWHGITCDNGRVTHIDLWENQLTGNIPAEIGNLTNLRRLWLYDNQLTGNIPKEIGNLANLQILWLHLNQLTGTIPTEIGNLANLQSLWLHLNQLTGTIPTEIGNLNSLWNLALGRNQLTGSIPSEIKNLTNLEQFGLGNNQLTGSIPSEIASLTNLRDLWLDNNQLTGNIPKEIGQLDKLRVLWLDNNQLTGNIPKEIGNLANLQDLMLNDNQLTGNIPKEIGNLNNLERLTLENNQLTGGWPCNFTDFCFSLDYYNFNNNTYQPGTGDYISNLGFENFCASGEGASDIPEMNALGIEVPASILCRLPLTPDYFLGQWGDYPSTDRPAIIIREEGGQLYIHSLETASPRQYDWGEATTSIADAEDGILTFSWTLHNKTVYDTLVLVREDQIHRLSKTVMNDGSGQEFHQEYDHDRQRCVDYLDLAHITGNDISYTVEQYIWTDGSVDNNRSVVFNTANEAFLDKGFTVESGASFEVSIQTCQTGINCAEAFALSTTGQYDAPGPSTGNGCENCSDAQHATWYYFEVPADGTISIESCLGGTDTRLFVYEGDCGALSYMTENDDDCPISSTNSDLYASSISGLAVQANQTIYFEWDDRWSDAGFTFSFNFVAD